MTLLREFLDQMPAESQPIHQICIGYHWTMVCGKKCGLASTMAGEHTSYHQPIQHVGNLQKQNVQTLAEWVLSTNLLEASIGMAALNAALPFETKNSQELNAAQIILENCSGKDVAIVGNFPFVNKVNNQAKNCWVLDKKEFTNSLPAIAASEIIPRADIVAISGTALINHSMEELLNLCNNHALIIILGPSTPLHPIWFEHGIYAYSGTEIDDSSTAMLCIQQAAIFKQVKGVRLLSYVRDNTMPMK